MGADDDIALDATIAPSAGSLELDATIGAEATRPQARKAAVPSSGDHIGRFVVLDALGAGGMGTVVGAYDPTLDRKLAIKLLHLGASDDARERMLREARAMARLSHPNVLVVHEVGVWEGQVFIAMELAAGGTLRAWCAVETRGWREVLTAYRDAARGLAAAHDAGMVHRDFKPDNVLLTRDGVVRVADFGLVGSAQTTSPSIRTIDPSARAEPSPDGSLGVELTHAGSLLGTPAYMAPEQHLGERVGPAADQFALCVSLWEALYGGRPFGGKTLDELAASTLRGKIAPPARDPGVPARIRLALERGLRPEPDQRWPSIGALSDAIALDPPRSHRLWMALAAATAIAGIVVTFVLVRRDERDPAAMCDRARDPVTAIWTPERRAALADAFGGTGRADAPATWRNVAGRLDEHVASIAAVRVEACRATHVRGDQSAHALDLRTRCADARLEEVSALLGVWEAGVDASALDHALDAPDALTPLDGCDDVASLEKVVAPPTDPELIGRIGVIEAQLAKVSAEHAAGHYPRALELATLAHAAAETTGYAPIRGAAATALGDALTNVAEYADAERLYLGAVHRAGEAHDDQAAMWAWHDIAFVRSAAYELTATDLVIAAARAAAARSADPVAANSRVDVVEASLRLREGRFNDALRLYRARLAFVEATAPGTIAVANAERELAVALGQAGLDPEELRLAQSAHDRTVALLDEDHPSVATSLATLASAYTRRSDLDRAGELYAERLAILSATYGPESPLVADALLDTGINTWWRGNFDDGLLALDQAMAIYAAHGHKSSMVNAYVSIGDLEYVRRRLGDARDAYQAGLDLADEVFVERPLRARLLQGLGMSMQDVGDLDGAMDLYRRTLTLQIETYGPSSGMLAPVLNALGTAHNSKGDQKRALEYYIRARDLSANMNGEDDLQVVIQDNNIGNALRRQGDLAGAIARHERALEAFTRVLGSEHAYNSYSASALAVELAISGGDATRALALAQRALELADTAGATPGERGFIVFAIGVARWSGGDRKAGLAKVREGRALLVSDGANSAQDLAEVDAWLADHGGGK